MKIILLPLRCVNEMQQEKRQQKMPSQDEVKNNEVILSRHKVIALKG